ncbi:MAG: hypothetical protein AAGJ81_01505 [Verrucomicrobiota bacterium]
MPTKSSIPKPNPKRIRAALILKGMNVSDFARKHGFPRSTVQDALTGRRGGVITVRIMEALKKEVGK